MRRNIQFIWWNEHASDHCLDGSAANVNIPKFAMAVCYSGEKQRQTIELLLNVRVSKTSACKKKFTKIEREKK